MDRISTIMYQKAKCMFKADVTHWANPGLKVLMEQVTHMDARRGDAAGLTQVVYGVSKELNDLFLQYGTQTEIHDGLLQMTGYAVDYYADELPQHDRPIEEIVVQVGMDITFNKLDVTIYAIVSSHKRKGQDAGITTFVGVILENQVHDYIKERGPTTTLQ